MSDKAVEAAGMVLVPRELTDKMNQAYVDAYANSAAATAWETRKEAYRAMIAATEAEAS